NLLLEQGFDVYSLERGVKSKTPLDYSKAPLPLVLADLRAQVKTLDKTDEALFHQRFQLLVQRKLTKEERLFLHRYPQLLQFLEFPQGLKSELTHLQEASIVTESDLKQILLEKLFLLSPEERLKGLTPEERLKGLTSEERKKLLELLQKEEPKEP
ncbi:MAG: hypothetical protein ACFFBD_15790, partial [Candidatus Hodarchaeota archaeon]